ncbi:arylsulfatase [Rubritalea tangerina]|uniref:arylsulfatase n=1 Tax=Rubritalea tangerina TaxID=430798 RepID=UPI00360A62F5
MAWAVSRPNIITILVDDLGYSDIGSYGGEIETPHIDALAAGGVRFTQFYTTSRCCPSRASLLTGLYPHQVGIGHMVYRDYGDGYRKNLSRGCVTFGEVLQQAGYRTFFSGKWYVGHTDKEARPEQRGFDKFTGVYSHIDAYWSVLKGCEIYRDNTLLIPAGKDPVNPYRPDEEFYITDFFTDVAIDYVDQAAEESGKPFLLHLCYNTPHFPLEAPEALIEKYRGRYLKGWDIMRAEKLERMRVLGVVSEGQELPRVKGFKNVSIRGFTQVGVESEWLRNWGSLAQKDREELDFRRAMYAAQVENLDQNVGRLVAHLKAKGLYENTVILFLSDNGCSGETGLFGMQWGRFHSGNYHHWRKRGGWSISQGQGWAAYSNTPLRKYKKFVHEGGIASPLIVHWPGGLPARGEIVSGQSFHLIDIMPTLCELGGATYPERYRGHRIPPMEGHSMVSYLKDPDVVGEARRLYWQHENHAAMREGDWKLVTVDDRVEGRWELYDLSDDRSESENLAARYPEKVKALRQQWESWARRVKAVPFPEDR